MSHVTEGMPVTNGKFEVLFHGFASDYSILIVVTEGHGVIGFNALKGYFFDTGKEFSVASDNTHNYVPVLESKG
tara:strand:- start:1632 stop:1853 length:222 start_codon:yes stop_codon:yes gene_type:complete